MSNYQAPNYVLNEVKPTRDKTSQEVYKRWLNRRASSHFNRDKKGYNGKYTIEEYRVAIHEAVRKSEGKDKYTGKFLKWELISTFNNKKAKRKGWKYMKKFSDLPTVDHVNRGENKLNFNICSWRVNDSKSNMTLKVYIHLAVQIIAFNKKRNKK